MEKFSWKILDEYFKEYGFFRHQFETFNNFIYSDIEQIIKNEGKIEIPGYTVIFSEVNIGSPVIIDERRKIIPVFPQDCRERDLTYETSLCVNIKEIFYDEEKNITNIKTYVRIPIAKIPVMINSKICNLYNLTKKEKRKKSECIRDNGGYFIIRGKERALVAQLRGVYNKIQVYTSKNNKYSFLAEIRSMSSETNHSVLVQSMIGKDNRTIVFSLPFIKELIPVGIVLKAFGFLEKNDIKNIIGLSGKKVEKFYELIYRDAFFIKTQEDALKYIGNYSLHINKEENKTKYTWQVLETELFPHLGIIASNKQKILLLGSMVNKLLSTHLGFRSEDDRDNYKNKRIESAGLLCKELFRTLYKRFLKTIKQQLEKKKFTPDIISIINRNNNISTGLKYSFATGNWGLQKNSYIRTGVSQVLSRLTYGASLSHLRRLVIPIGKEGKNVKIRQIHPSQIFYVCPIECPEGASAGIVLNLSLTTSISKNISKLYVKSVIYNNITDFYKLGEYEGDFKITKILLNGEILGFTEDYDNFIEKFKFLRNHNVLNKTISISYNNIDNEVCIYCDEGRLIRPIIKLENNKLPLTKEELKRITWKELEKRNIVQYIDNSEIEEFVIAMNIEDTYKFHCDYLEINPNMIMGIMGAMIPFADHSQSPRNIYQSNMGKQAIGLYTTSYKKRYDTIVNVLDTPQKPLVSTKMSKIMGFDDMASGINVIVAISTYGGLMC